MKDDWAEAFPAAITVCDARGVVVEMNAAAARAFEKDGGRALVGRSLLDCHPEPARTRLLQLLRSQEANVYTIEKDGAKKLIYQAPWHVAGEFRGIVELALPLPSEVPHFVRG
jgi:PAS domain-containing protein